MIFLKIDGRQAAKSFLWDIIQFMAQAKHPPIPVIVPPKARDYSVFYIAAALLLFLTLAFGVAWYYVKDSPRMMFRSAYLDTGQMIVAVDGYSIAARFSVQTSKDNGDWAIENKKSIAGAIQKALVESDPHKMLTPSDLNTLQSSLRKNGNAFLQTDKIENVLLTEFLIKPIE